MRTKYGVILFALAMISSLASAEQQTEAFAIGLSPEFFKMEPQSAGAMLWLVYANERVSYAESHAAAVRLKDKRVVPSFEDELAARKRAVELFKVMKKEKPDLGDSYWDVVEKVADAGFIEEYVWEFLHQKSWSSDAAPKRVSEFRAYRSKELAGHAGLTLASVLKN